MPAFPLVLFDLDHTLFDFEGSKVIAFNEVLAAEGVSDPSAYLDLFNKVERPLWAGLEQGELTLDSLNSRRFEGLVDAADLDADPATMASSYLAWLGKSGGLFPGARDLLDDLVDHCTLALVSNGYGEVQHARMDNFEIGHYFDAIIVSSEVGVAKPHRSFFDHAFDALGNPDPTTALMVGDSLTSDMAGANNYGLTCCWYNPGQAPAPDHLDIDFTVSDLAAIRSIVLDGETIT